MTMDVAVRRASFTSISIPGTARPSEAMRMVTQWESREENKNSKNVRHVKGLTGTSLHPLSYWCSIQKERQDEHGVD